MIVRRFSVWVAPRVYPVFPAAITAVPYDEMMGRDDNMDRIDGSVSSVPSIGPGGPMVLEA